jgi:hypothetical protein
MNYRSFSTKSAKGGKVQTEQMFSGWHLKADARRLREKNRKQPAMERVTGAFS